MTSLLIAKSALILKINRYFVSDASYILSGHHDIRGEWMKHAACELYTRVGTARGSGKGLVMEIAGACYYITPDEMPELMMDRAADVVDLHGEREGTAWLSPIIYPRKKELTALIKERVYMIPYRDFSGILAGNGHRVLVREFHSEHP
jgi:hypothetical protein